MTVTCTNLILAMAPLDGIQCSHPVYMHASLEPEWKLTYDIKMAVKKPNQTLKTNRFLIFLKKLETLTPFGRVS